MDDSSSEHEFPEFELHKNQAFINKLRDCSTEPLSVQQLARSLAEDLQELPNWPSHQSPTSSFKGFTAAALSDCPLTPNGSNIISFGSDGNGSSMRVFHPGLDWHAGSEKRAKLPALSAPEHVIAERKRREKMQQQFTALASVLPGLKKMDRISLLGGAIAYVKQLEERLKTLEAQAQQVTDEYSSVVDEDHKCAAALAADGSTSRRVPMDRMTAAVVPQVEACVQGADVLLRVSCKKRQGVLVAVLAEVEKLSLPVASTSVVPFTDATLNITIATQIEEAGCVVELVNNIKAALINS